MINPTVVQLPTGLLIVGIEPAEWFAPGALTGWLSGRVYVSEDNGQTWQQSSLGWKS